MCSTCVTDHLCRIAAIIHINAVTCSSILTLVVKLSQIVFRKIMILALNDSALRVTLLSVWNIPWQSADWNCGCYIILTITSRECRVGLRFDRTIALLFSIFHYDDIVNVTLEVGLTQKCNPRENRLASTKTCLHFIVWIFWPSCKSCHRNRAYQQHHTPQIGSATHWVSKRHIG